MIKHEWWVEHYLVTDPQIATQDFTYRFGGSTQFDLDGFGRSRTQHVDHLHTISDAHGKVRYQQNIQ